MSGEIVRRRERTDQRTLGPSTPLADSLWGLVMAFERAGRALKEVQQELATRQKIETGEVIDVEYREVNHDDDE